jgi:hypothetical protein
MPDEAAVAAVLPQEYSTKHPKTVAARSQGGFFKH